MNTSTQMRMSFLIVSLIFGVASGCAPAAPQPVDPTTTPPVLEATQPVDATTTAPAAEATLPSDWERYTQPGPCGYTIDHPADMEGTTQALNSWSLRVSATDPVGLVPNFIYVSVIPADFQGGPGEIYNYDPAETQTLLGLQVGEGTSLREDPNLASWFTYTRLPDTTLGNQAAQTYENTQPWEFPAGTKELRYYLQANGCTYLVGGYMATVGSGEPGAISQERFNEILATFQVNP